MDFEVCKKAFLNHLQLHQQASPHTIRAYLSDLNQFRDYQERVPGSDFARGVDAYLGFLRSSGMRESTCQRRLVSLKNFFGFLGISLPHFAKISSVPEGGRKRVSEETVLEILKNTEEPVATNYKVHARDAALCELLYACGIRASEAVLLDFESISFQRGWVRVLGKGNKEREIPVGETALEKIKKYCSAWNISSGPLFRNTQNERLHVRSVGRIVKSFRPDFHPHLFRHAFATHLLNRGADLRSIQELLGHAQLSTTEKYTHLTLEEIQNEYEKCHPLKKPLKGA